MRFNRLDLNLLVALDALMKERSITRAAERLNLSPSSTSNALARLREYFDDELLVQVGRKMELTPRAEGLEPAVRDLLVRVESTIAMQPEFVPSKSERTFRVFASDYTQMVFAPYVLGLANEDRCSSAFEFLPLVESPQRDLERGEADLLIMPRGFLSTDHPDELLYEEEFVCVVWKDAQIARGDLTFERYVSAGHVIMRPPGVDRESFEAWFVRRFGLSRRVAVTSYGFASTAALVVGTENIATVHGRLARRLQAGWPIDIRPAPVPITHMEQCVQWHRYRTQDPGLVWLRALLRKAVVRMDAAPGP